MKSLQTNGVIGAESMDTGVALLRLSVCMLDVDEQPGRPAATENDVIERLRTSFPDVPAGWPRP